MLLVDVEQLAGVALDWAVAKCAELPVIEDPMGFKKDSPNCAQAGFWVWDSRPKGQMQLIGDPKGYSPTTNRNVGCLIIEQENISSQAPNDNCSLWITTKKTVEPTATGSNLLISTGSTLLISAMRTHVKSVLGELIEVPKSLMNE